MPLKIPLYVFSALILLGMAAPTVNGYESDHIADAIALLQPKLRNTEVRKISKAIKTVYVESHRVIPWQLIVSIAFHESTFRISAVNAKTADYGMMQISKNNIARLRLDKTRLMNDYTYGLRVAVKLVMYNKQNYAHKIPYWLGMYRSGNALWKPGIRRNALAYDKIVRDTAKKIGYSKADTELARAE